MTDELDKFGREQWLEERRKGLGGSDSPVVLGQSPFRDVHDLWRDKKGLLPDEEPSPVQRAMVAAASIQFMDSL